MRRQRIDEEDSDERERQRGKDSAGAREDAPVRLHAQRRTMSVHSSIQRSRLAPIVAGSNEITVRRAWPRARRRPRAPPRLVAPGRRTCCSGMSAWNSATSMKSMNLRAPVQPTSAPCEHTGEFDLPEAAIGRGRRRRLGRRWIRENDLRHRARGVGHDDRPIALARAAGERRRSRPSSQPSTTSTSLSRRAAASSRARCSRRLVLAEAADGGQQERQSRRRGRRVLDDEHARVTPAGSATRVVNGSAVSAANAPLVDS